VTGKKYKTWKLSLPRRRAVLPHRNLEITFYHVGVVEWWSLPSVWASLTFRPSGCPQFATGHTEDLRLAILSVVTHCLQDFEMHILINRPSTFNLQCIIAQHLHATCPSIDSIHTQSERPRTNTISTNHYRKTSNRSRVSNTSRYGLMYRPTCHVVTKH